MAVLEREKRERERVRPSEDLEGGSF